MSQNVRRVAQSRSARVSYLLLAGLLVLAEVQAAENGFSQCANNANDSERLKCYDDLARGQKVLAVPAKPATVALPEISQPETENEEKIAWQDRSYLTKAWNLDGRARENKAQLTPLRPYRTSYLILRGSKQPNILPSTPAAGHQTQAPLDLNKLEAKFQFSFKAEVMSYREINWLNFDNFRLWGAYTQQSNWQAFNARNSSPFRETNYEPELIATFGTANPEGLKLVNLGFAHQSNGKPLPESRSWNRVYLQGGWEWDSDLSVLARAWWRVPESAAKNDNPDLADYLGRGDAVIRWEPDRTQAVTLLLRNNLQMGSNRGFVQLDWTTPLFIGKSAKLHAQLTSGHGESLIDYNHQQTTIGLGMSFREW